MKLNWKMNIKLYRFKPQEQPPLILCWTILQNKKILDLSTRVDELQKYNKHQLSLMDINYKNYINELTEKCHQQISSLNAEKEVSVKKPKTFLFHNTNSLLNL